MQNKQSSSWGVQKAPGFFSGLGYSWIYAIVILLVVLIDQATKIMAQESLRDTPPVILFSDILTLKYIVNTGIAFGMPLQGTFLLVCTAVLIAGLCWYVIQQFAGLVRLERWGYILIIAGALGNAYDRFFHGFVIDFISLKYFAIFNVADIVITIGAILIIVAQLKTLSHAKHQ